MKFFVPAFNADVIRHCAKIVQYHKGGTCEFKLAQLTRPGISFELLWRISAATAVRFIIVAVGERIQQGLGQAFCWRVRNMMSALTSLHVL